jgi:hypothetical protein
MDVTRFCIAIDASERYLSFVSCMLLREGSEVLLARVGMPCMSDNFRYIISFTLPL